MSYVLECESEFKRLEEQSCKYGYDFRKELESFHCKSDGVILDAGCGSGIVTRYLAQSFPKATVIGCDASELRIGQARKVSNHLSNLKFAVEDLTKLSFGSNSLDAITCRYVIEHLSDDQRAKTLKELFRCTRPGGSLTVIDFDGLLYNIFPQTSLVTEVLGEFQVKRPLDLWVGRKLPSLLEAAGFSKLTWSIETCAFQGEHLIEEREMAKTRFEQAFDSIAPLFGGGTRFKKFCEEYLQCLDTKHSVLFYNKFVVTGTKARLI